MSDIETDIEARTLRRVTVRLVPLLMALYFVNYLDRTNLGIAKAEVSADLQLSATMFGLASGIFFIGYVLVEVPSNLALVRFGARRWLARIAVSWGVVAVALGFAPNATTLLVLRFLLGVAEAGLFPGVVFYLSQWFPAAYRARVVGVFMLAIPIASAIGTPLAAWLIQTGHGVFGLAGWRFMMICVGLPVRTILSEWLPTTTAPEPVPTESTPLAASSVVVRLALSTSLTCTPWTRRGVSSLVVSRPGTVCRGASLTGVTVIRTVPVSSTPSLDTV